MFSHKYRYLIILFLSLFSYSSTLFIETFKYYGININSYYIISIFFVSVLTVWETNRLLEKNVGYVYQLLKKKIHVLAIHFLLSNFFVFTFTIIPTFLLAKYFFLYKPEEMLLPIKLMLTYAMRVNLFLNTVNFVIHYLRALRETQVEAERFKKISVQAQFESLKNQINPHFLFNNMNVLSTLIYKDQQIASEFILQLCKVYRYLLQNYNKELVALDEELDFIKSYLYLLQIRYGDNLKVMIDIQDHELKLNIVPAALQMLIENAIKHNIVSKKKPMTISISSRDKYLIVANSLQLKEEREISTNLGLNNINKRYEFVSKQSIKVEQENNLFTVKLPLISIIAS